MAAHLVGRDEDSADVWARAHHEWLEPAWHRLVPPGGVGIA